MRTAPSGISGMWLAGLRVGLKTLPNAPMLGIKRLILPISYWRAREFAYVARQLATTQLPDGARILDLGSPKDLALFLARARGYAITAVDILDDAIELSHRYATACGANGDGPGKVDSRVCDGRALPFKDNSFDAIFSVSVIEHIPEHGDSDAIRELVRVVKPGGLIVITTPYDRTYRETFVEGPVYERNETGQNFFERHYDDEALRTRLFQPSGAEVTNLEIWGEGAIRAERIMNAVGPLRTALSPLEPLCASLFLREMDRNGPGNLMAVFFTLRKPM